MLASIGRLVSISVVVLTLTVFAVVFMRVTGLKQQFQAPPHAWFEQKEWNVFAPSLADLCSVAPNTVHDGWILQLPIQKSGDTWGIPCAGRPTGAGHSTSAGRPTGASASLPLQDFLARSPQKEILLKVEAASDDDLDKLVEIASSFEKLGKSFAVNAPAQKVARQLRKVAPQWLFAADSASLLRLHMFESLWLETAMDFWPDFVIASTNAKDGTRLSEREATELHRRHKRIIWNENSNREAPFAVDGVLLK